MDRLRLNSDHIDHKYHKKTHYDYDVLKNAYEHPSMHNITTAITKITDIGVDALTCIGKE